ncbi:MAG: alpha/beta fold hydrolase [Chloroflexota bacterium]
MEKINFYSAGHKLSGFINIPAGAKGKVPGIVCCHGYSGNIQLYMADIAQKISEAGYATIIFYHRGLGESEGPVSRVIPQEQSEDIRNAITYMQTRPEVDPDRIGLYGTSLGGANVIYTAGNDKRVKCVVETGGIGNGERLMISLRRRWEWLAFLKEIEEDRAKRVLTGVSRIVDPHYILPADPDTINIMIPRFEKFRTEHSSKGYPLETADALMDYKPEQVAEKISPSAALFIHTANDVLVPPEESWNMYERAKEPKKIVIIPNCVHYDVYKFNKPAVFKKVMATAVAWFKEYLPV